MDRIIIREKDNTSNVESLSSYDVAYVPGFSADPSESYYRNPIFVTDKYDFVNKFGNTCPAFSEDQPYFITVGGNKTWLFPDEAIPDSEKEEVYQPVQTNNFASESVIEQDYSEYYTKVIATIESIATGIAYYGLKNEGQHVSLSTITGTNEEIIAEVNAILSTDEESEEPVEKEYTAVYSSTFSPKNNNFYEQNVNNEYVKTEDTNIDNTADNPKSYFTKEEGAINMFNAGDGDPGYRYALALLSKGMPVYFEQMNKSESDITVKSMYDGLVNRFVGTPSNPDLSFDSMGDYSVKYITSGGYPTFELTAESGYGDLAQKMMEIASERKDSIALIDHTDNPDRPLTTYDEKSVINSVRDTSYQISYESYGAMFTPWFECTDPAVTNNPGSDEPFKNTTMPGSFAYLSALAGQVQTYNPWLAVSGVTRGRVPYCSKLHTTMPLTNNIADTYQVLPSGTERVTAISINPITYIRNYGYCIWGNRTLRNNSSGTKATSFLNVRSAVSDIKKRLFDVSQQLLFEQNTDVLWLNFKSLVTPLLETMKSDYILSDYTISRLFINPEDGAAVPAYEVMAVIRIQPINSVEIFDLTVMLENNEEFNIVTTEVTE